MVLQWLDRRADVRPTAAKSSPQDSINVSSLRRDHRISDDTSTVPGYVDPSTGPATHPKFGKPCRQQRRAMRALINATTFVLLLTCSFAAFAEEPGVSDRGSGGAQYYVYADRDWELQINVYVWGQVLKPGMYSVPRTTDLIGVISLAGGPGEHANLKKVRVIRNNPGAEVLTVNVLEYMRTADTSSVPVLHPGDTVIVPEGRSLTVSKVISCVSQLAIIANVYYVFFVQGK